MSKDKVATNKRMMEVFLAMLNGRKAVVVDTHDHKEKKSDITAVYCDGTVILADCIHVEYKVHDIIRLTELKD
jgi:hypothetical protein